MTPQAPAGAIQARARLLEQMSRGEKPLGIFVSSLDPAATQIMADAEFDFVVLDAEHGRLSRFEVECHVRAAEAGGITPFVRILENSPALIQSMLDAGAHGIVVPHVDTAEDARLAVAASRYAPYGRRGMCPACHAGRYTLDGWAERASAANANTMVIPIIESQKAVENIEEILAVDGIDVVHFGPGDLSADMGIDFVREGHRMVEAWHHCMNATLKAGKRMLAPAGFDYENADMLIVEMDLMVLRRAVSTIVARYKSPPRKDG